MINFSTVSIIDGIAVKLYFDSIQNDLVFRRVSILYYYYVIALNSAPKRDKTKAIRLKTNSNPTKICTPKYIDNIMYRL